MSRARVDIEGSARPPLFGAVLQGDVSPDEIMTAVLWLRTPECSPPLVETAWSVVRTREPWSHERYAATYAASPEDVARIEAFARAYDLSVIDVHRAARTVTLCGTAQSFEVALGVKWKRHAYRGEIDVTHDAPLSVPASLDGMILWVFLPRNAPITNDSPPLRRRTDAPPAPPAATPDKPWRFHPPSRFAELYDFPAELTGEGVCLGVLSLYGGFSHDDMRIFFEGLGMRAPEILTVGPNRWATGPDTWANYEVSMDAQIAFSCAPGVRPVVYFSGARGNADTTTYSYFQLFNAALFDTENRPSVLTLSAGLPEDLPGVWTQAEATRINELFVIAAILGITICLPSGDSGSIFPMAQGMFSAPSLVYFPGSSPWVLCCGGTTLILDERGARKDEVVWNRLADTMLLAYGHAGRIAHLGSSSGGVSGYFERPAWQARAAIPVRTFATFRDWVFTEPASTFAGRGCPDVAAHADFFDGYRIFVDGAYRYGGGTSASTPLLAALVARLCQGVGRRLGFLNPLLYRLQLEEGANVFRPIVAGNNGGYAASSEAGWNACTGLGAPRGRALLEALRKVYSV
ncbi:S53 family peptidase [Polyangium sorediatum]|uniref:S53 family serine peptidase n=1 Tax=Polyangium sorediatum TaxID=889274 RepID=A0ABT6NJQ7_9BACT|nr:S53 family serine peptidase [Polyangium sorediatum]MDI1428544.1 S53 family serine peptidase [Polyangium sorediatum]